MLSSLAAAQNSGHRPAAGEQFFLLADSGFASTEMASVRLEAPGRSSEVAAYGGADIVLYRVPQPLEFLKAQRNLHRIQLQPRYQGEGLANTLSWLWDSWYKKSRQLWQSIFTSRAREQVVKTAPALKQAPRHSYATRLVQAPQFKPMPGYDLVKRFRYPLHQARPIAPPADVRLTGSSSEFLTPNEGNVRVPLGVLKPGLYVVEAYIGSFRATTLLFVADTVAATKISGQQLLVWTAHKKSGVPAAGAEIVWTDGAGTLKSGRTDARGLLLLERESPERSYVLGQDATGGVFVSENFYYDSEIYATKLFAVTDRPLYRPGDWVQVKMLGREFINALSSRPLPAGTVDLAVFDASGTQLLTLKSPFDPATGADARFRLPDNAGAGGYQLRMHWQGGVYSAAFRVAQYVKPQYEINVVLDKPVFVTGDAVRGRVQLNYSDGKPVSGATVSLTAKMQKLTLVDAQLDYLGNRIVALEKAELTTNDEGVAEFNLPPASEPSRYLLSVLSSDQAAYRVSASREILVQAGQGRYAVQASRQFTAPQQVVAFSWKALSEQRPQPVRWETLRLEDRERQQGALPAKAMQANIRFTRPGSYTVSLFDAAGNVLGATSHWVSGPGLQVTPGSISIVFDKPRYSAGETARALLTFDQPVADALLTLERDRVEAHALLSAASGWARVQRDSPTQWRVEIPVRPEYGPNMTFSVLTIKNGQQLFQNKGLVVQLPRVELGITPQKTVYRPGELVNVDVSALLGGKAVPAQLSVSVVDEMIYVLQPEIAPDVFDFFYHVRRNNVRTSSSLNFHSYDMALSPKVDAPASAARLDRPFKVMERPRREDVDTAAWIANLATDADGRARLSFRMPDSLTRWRITVRAMTSDGQVGQAIAHVRSDKPLYLKWIGPTRFRAGDSPEAAVALFNPQGPAREVELQADGLDAPFVQKVQARQGATYIKLPLTLNEARAVTVRVRDRGQDVDRLQTTLQAEAPGWPGLQYQRLQLTAQETVLRLPADASGLRLQFGGGHEAWRRVLDDLISYPFGCVEQTASRLIPLTLALENLPATDNAQALRNDLEQRLLSSRLRLVQLAGADARFGWWGDQSDSSPLLTAYAYFADRLAARHLGIELPPDHAQPVLEAYQRFVGAEPLFNRAISLWLMQQMGLPTATLAEGLLRDLQSARTTAPAPRPGSSLVLHDGDVAAQADMTLSLLAVILRANGTTISAELAAQIAAAQAVLGKSDVPLARALLLLATGNADVAAATSVLEATAGDQPTIDRALALLWAQAATRGAMASAAGEAGPALAAPWQASRTLLGSTVWRHPGTPGRELRLALPAAPTQPLTAQLSYETRQPDVHRLPVRLTRTLYRLRPGDGHLQFRAEPVADNAALRNDELYVDEIELLPATGKRFRYGVLEVALPPGADVEPTTWGLKIDGLGQGESLPSARFEPGSMAYAVPVAELGGRVVIRHLLRFSQRGRFQLPPARFWRMYQPEDKALQDEGRGNWRLQVE